MRTFSRASRPRQDGVWAVDAYVGRGPGDLESSRTMTNVNFFEQAEREAVNTGRLPARGVEWRDMLWANRQASIP
jgi:hypothetical protein